MLKGFRVFGADTHFQPSVESILPYMGPSAPRPGVDSGKRLLDD